MVKPYALRGLTLANRIVVSPVLTYQDGGDGLVGDFHLVHYGVGAQGGAAGLGIRVKEQSLQGRFVGRRGAGRPFFWRALSFEVCGLSLGFCADA
jgi:anthraniloyl-CoA monooxygenase